jgi:hypothetical protein
MELNETPIKILERDSAALQTKATKMSGERDRRRDKEGGSKRETGKGKRKGRRRTTKETDETITK